MYILEAEWGFKTFGSEGHRHIRDDDAEEEEAEKNLPDLELEKMKADQLFREQMKIDKKDELKYYLEGANVGHHCLTGHQSVS